MDRYLTKKVPEPSTSTAEAVDIVSESDSEEQVVGIRPVKRKREECQHERNFRSEWTSRFCVIQHGGSTFCMICKQGVKVLKLYNVRRHYTTMHSDFEKTHPFENVDDRAKAIAQLVDEVSRQQKALQAAMTEAEMLSLASYEISWTLAKACKPDSDGELVKECFLRSVNA